MSAPTKRIDEIFPPHVIKRLMATFNRLQGHPGLHAELTSIIAENIATINAMTGQENDPSYLAYAIEHAANQVAR